MNPRFIIEPPADFLSQQPHLPALAKQLSEAYEDKQIIITDAALQAVGSALWLSIAELPFDEEPLGESLQQAKKQCGLQPLAIIVQSQDAAVLALPWESLFHPEFGFLAREQGFSLSRRLAEASPDLPALEDAPLRILLFTCLPDDLAEGNRLRVEDEQAAAFESLIELERSGKAILEMPDDGRLETFKSYLSEFKPHLVYLSGHGQFNHEPHNDRAWGEFLFENEHGNSQLVPEQELSKCFEAQRSVQCCVLSACLSARQHPAYLHHGLSQSLHRAGVPHVIGMRESIFDLAGISFARSLLHALANQRPLAEALQQARAAITNPLSDSPLFDAASPEHREASFGQWSLPQLYSHDLFRPLHGQDFVPQPRHLAHKSEMIGMVSQPQRFIGRRRKLRQLQRKIRQGDFRSLLITGAGGMGKTALAGKLVRTLQKQGNRVFAFSLRPEHDWQDVLLEMRLALKGEAKQTFKEIQTEGLDVAKEAHWLLKLLLEQMPGGVVLFFDNLESVQQMHNQQLQDATLACWIAAAQQLTGSGLKLILTSRWRLPDWPETEHLPLDGIRYADYKALASSQQLNPSLLADGQRLRHAHAVLGGNARGLEFFIAATQGMDMQEQSDFLQRLEDCKEETQADMALTELMAQRSDDERLLLDRLLAYRVPVPLDGIKVVLRAEPSPATPTTALLQSLLALSLLEQSSQAGDDEADYQLDPLLRDWLLHHGSTKPTVSHVKIAASFMLWLLEERINTRWDHKLATHQSLLEADIQQQAHRLVLDWVVGPLNRAGLYQQLLEQWLPPLLDTQDKQIRSEALGQIGKQYYHIADYDTALQYLKQSLAIRQEIGDKSGEGTTLNNISQIYDARGDYDTALQYLKQSLAIQQEIGDKSGEGTTLNNIATTAHARGDYDTALQFLKQSLAIQQEIGDIAGLCVTLFNIGHIHWQNEEQQEAVGAWVKVYGIAKKINLAQVLNALESLTAKLGQQGGLQYWENLAQQTNTPKE